MKPDIFCNNDKFQTALGMTNDGVLMLSHEGKQWEYFDFNNMYAGYYPACTFTAIACFYGLFYAAGIDKEQTPYVFTSTMGGVWSEANLLGTTAWKKKIRVSGKVIRILGDAVHNQIFLICDNGELVTLPDCPKCVKLCQPTKEKVSDGWLENDTIILQCVDGKNIKIPANIAVQYRAKLDFVKMQIALYGGYIVDLRNESAVKACPIHGTVHVPVDEAADWLKGIPCDKVIAFFCSFGIRADEITIYARNHYFKRAYTLGSIAEFLK